MKSVKKKLVAGVMVTLGAFSAETQACSDLQGLEAAIMKSDLPADTLLVTSMNRMGYGVNPKSYLNTRSAVISDQLLGRQFLATLLAREIRASYAQTNRFSAASVNEARTLYPFTYGLSMWDVVQRYRALVNGQPLGTPESNQYRSDLMTVPAARKMSAILNTPNYNLPEVIGDFWFNHFNVDGGNNLTLHYDAALRANQCKTFYDMLLASSRHPVMLSYLDNIRNSRQIKNSQGVVIADVNENYGRELVELHTLGVGPVVYKADGTEVNFYNPAEVFESSRVMTGWHYASPPTNGLTDIGFFFNVGRNDQGIKNFPRMFRALYGGPTSYGPGLTEARRYLMDLARHPYTKMNICKKLGMHLLGGFLTQDSYNRCLSAYGEVGDLPAMYEAYILSADFWNSKYANAGFKTPQEYVASLVRGLGFAGRPDLTSSRGFLMGRMWSPMVTMGQPVYRVGPPTGYPVGLTYFGSPSYINRALNHSFQLTKFLQLSFNSLKDLDLERVVEGMNGMNGQTKDQRQVDMALKNIAPVFPNLDNSNLKMQLARGLREGKADKAGSEKLPVRSVVTQALGSYRFMRK